MAKRKRSASVKEAADRAARKSAGVEETGPAVPIDPPIHAKKKMGRPTTYNLEIATQICEHLAEGRSLRSFCALESTPNKATVMRWLRDHEEFRDQYARAREDQAECLADETIDIADDGTNDYVLRKRGDEDIEVVNNDHITRSRLRIDTRKWFAGKVRPKKYGDKNVTEISGKDGGPIETAAIDLTETERARRIAFLLTRATA